MSYENDLKEKLPLYQRGNQNLDELLEAVGKLLDGFETSVTDFKNYSDYQTISEDQLDNLAGQFDLVFPRNLSIARKREIIKDAIAIYRSNGTERALKRVFKLIGWKVSLDYCWTLNPDISEDVQFSYDGTILYVDTGVYTYNISPVSSPVGLYSLIYGNEKIYADGTYADLYDASGNEYPKTTIKGEIYNTIQYGTLVVAKAPYIRINVDQEDYDLFTQDYVDPTTGDVYSYSETEEYDLTQEMIDYFLESARPANVGILEIATPFALQDMFTSVPTEGTFSTSHINVGAVHDGTLSYGVSMDRYTMGETFGGFEYGTTAMNLLATPPHELCPRTYPIGTVGTQRYIPTRKTVDLTLTVPSDALVAVYTSISNRVKLRDGLASWKLLGTYSNVTAQVIPIIGKFAIHLNIVTPSSTGDIIADVLQK